MTINIATLVSEIYARCKKDLYNHGKNIFCKPWKEIIPRWLIVRAESILDEPVLEDLTETVMDGSGHEYTVIRIGTQIWMKENYRHDYAGSAFYNDNEANGPIYGKMYSDDHIQGANFCPAGWHVPTREEMQTLIDYLGGSTVAGGRLKEVGTTHWNTPNTGSSDYAGFTALPGGRYVMGSYSNLNTEGNYWTQTVDPATEYTYFSRMVYNSAAISEISSESIMLSVRLIKD